VRERLKIGQLLVQAGLIDEEQLEEALAAQKTSGKMLCQTLIDLNYVREGQVLPILAKQYGCSFAEVGRLTLQPDIFKVIPRELIRKLHVLPIRVKDGVLTVAMSNPLDLEILDLLKGRTSMRIEPVVAMEESIDRAIAVADPGSKVAVKDVPKVAPTAIADQHIVEAIERGVNAVHFEPKEDGLLVRFSAGELLEDAVKYPQDLQDTIINRVKILSGVDTTDSRLPLAGSAKALLAGYEVDLLTETCPVIYGERALVRIRRGQQDIMLLKDLGLTEDGAKNIEAVLSKPTGLILVAGPKGCGKTTTICAILEGVGLQKRNSFAIEDPVEFELDHVNQVELNHRAGLNFSMALEACLKQDPDVLGFGMIPAYTVLETAFVAATNNCLITLPVPAGDPAGALGHIMDLGIRSFALGSALACIVSQRLVKRLCNDCKQPYTPTPDLLTEFRLRPDLKNVAFFKAMGCERCKDTGFTGHEGVLAILVASPELKGAVMEGQKDASLREIIGNTATGSLDYEVVRKLASGVTTVEEARRVFHTAGVS